MLRIFFIGKTMSLKDGDEYGYSVTAASIYVSRPRSGFQLIFYLYYIADSDIPAKILQPHNWQVSCGQFFNKTKLKILNLEGSRGLTSFKSPFRQHWGPVPVQQLFDRNDSFSGMDNLKTLDLRNNKIEVIEADVALVTFVIRTPVLSCQALLTGTIWTHFKAVRRTKTKQRFI